MKVFVTGATGMVGAHCALELLAAGHEVRLLVRDPDFARNYFAERGYDVTDLVVADMCDADAIRRGLKGCHALFHAAAMVNLASGYAREVYEGNTGSIASVVETAVACGIPNIVWVSSLSVLLRPGIDYVDEEAALAEPVDAYSRSKVECEKRVRLLQARGAPVQISYPGAVIGPHDPRFNQSNKALALFLSIVPRTSSGLQQVDARDLARFHRYLLEHPPSSDREVYRYIVGGPYLGWEALHTMLEQLTGTSIFHPRVSGGLLRAIGAMVDRAQRIRPFETQVSAESLRIATQWPYADSSRALSHANLEFRPIAKSIEDSIRWFAETGRVSPEKAGRLAPC
ncbi:NAD-dependent epimerase/dehydratase family protein [Parahaliea maris]|uniref:NAD-dependent epimerase/dehydratase family protein n=1 Tax=Parahaliea maris TaxID=2716870 RepID=A0A5C9A7Z9_9GAMM|nr:NAD-dependent epimerase/dehydratase family protein [Parahaliea maris]TXS96162.1 NAD-dependent epimerase/dehydratase family protein [Parahaliea maris]